MRKIERKMVEAAFGKKSVNLGNTSVEYLPAINTPVRSRMEMSKVYLHGNHIATVIHDSRYREVVAIKHTLRDWPTVTTKSRLRAFGVNVTTKKGVTYLDGEAI